MAVSEGFICALDRDVLDINGLGSSLLVDQQNRQTHKRARRTQDTFRDCGTFPYACPLNPSTCIMRFWLRPTRCGVLTGYVQVEAWRSGDMLPRATNRKGDRRNLRSYSGHADLDRPSNQCRSQYSTRYAGHQRDQRLWHSPSGNNTMRLPKSLKAWPRPLVERAWLLPSSATSPRLRFA
jgi:hypothetical protein